MSRECLTSRFKASGSVLVPPSFPPMQLSALLDCITDSWFLLSWKEIRHNPLLCTTWTHIRWMPMPWPWRLSERSSRTMTAIRCFQPWDSVLNCHLMEGCLMSFHWWVKVPLRLQEVNQHEKDVGPHSAADFWESKHMLISMGNYTSTMHNSKWNHFPFIMEISFFEAETLSQAYEECLQSNACITLWINLEIAN